MVGCRDRPEYHPETGCENVCTSAVFSIGFQTGSYLRGDQVNNFGTFGPGTANEINDTWTAVALSIEAINGGTDLTDVTNIIAFLSQNKGGEQEILVRNIVFSQ